MKHGPLQAAQLNAFEADGFVVLSDLFSAAMLDEVRSLLDPLFSRFNELPTHVRRDLGAEHRDSLEAEARSAEINRPTSLEPRLRASGVFRVCRAVARQLTGHAAAYTFDHAIYKTPNNQRPTHWHQDQAYSGHRRVLNTVHFWVPLQEATLQNGCMQFVPGSHLSGPVPHVHHPNGHTLHVNAPAEEHIRVCPVPIGGCTIHGPLTMHYTGPNVSAEIRRAWILHFGPWGRLSKYRPRILIDRIARLAGIEPRATPHAMKASS
ncbi:MAG TPA: phytanoyl-CoA dioxygenase family protein [Gemmatimonas sp.]|uniref:phytanoyl-CoA dioxygenase family protein n=1 Tax=Gemmatimonas sp. TaxID=1962908 RepID=UPI002EDB25CD